MTADAPIPPPYPGRLPAWEAGLILAAALLARVVVAFGVFPGLPLTSDAADYAADAAALLGDFPGHVPYYWPPGTALALAPFFALLGPGAAAARVATCLLGVIQVALVLGLAGRCLADRPAARAAGWLMALNPAWLLWGLLPYSEHLAAVGLLGAALGVVAGMQGGGAGPWLGAGLATGLGSLGRPSLLMVAVVALPALLWAAWRGRGGSLRAFGVRAGRLLFLYVAPVVLLLLPVMILNFEAGGGAVLSTNNERNFFMANNPYADPYKGGQFGSSRLEQLPPATRDYLVGMGWLTQTPAERRAMLQAGWEYLRDQPGEFAWRAGNRLRAFWGFPYRLSRELQTWLGWGPAGLLAFLPLEAGFDLLLLALALAGLTRERSRLRGWGWPVGFILAYQAPYVLAYALGTTICQPADSSPCWPPRRRPAWPPAGARPGGICSTTAGCGGSGGRCRSWSWNTPIT